MTQVQDHLPEALARLAERAPTNAPSASALLAAHRRRSRRTRAAAGVAAATAMAAGVGTTQYLLRPATPTAGRVQTAAPAPTPTATPKPPGNIRTLLKGPDLDQRWPKTLGTLATDDRALAAIRARAVELLYTGVEDRVGDTTMRLGFYKGRDAGPDDLRILFATDITTPSGATARVALLSAPPLADPPHRALYWLYGPTGADPSQLHVTNCPGPFVCVLALSSGAPLRGATAMTDANGHETVTPGTSVDGYLVAAPPGSAVAAEVGDRQRRPTGQVLAAAAPVADIAGLYSLPPGAARTGRPVETGGTIVSRSDGEVIWWEPFAWLP